MQKWIYLFLMASLAFAAESSGKRVCLNMIVKDESQVICRCLKTVKSLIDYWVIVDTGSKDGTQEIVREYLKDIPGELHERPWVDFAHNRNQAMQLAKGKGDYLLFVDADEHLEGAFDKNSLSKDVYLVVVRTMTEPLTTYQRALLINNHLNWYWYGVLHETLKGVVNPSFELAPNVVLASEAKDGNRAKDPQKYLKDAQVLERALLDEPNNADYVFYLAQSYYNAEKFDLALKNYKKRAYMDGWDQHTFWSMYSVGHLQEMLKHDSESIIKSYCQAFHYRPMRAEPLCRLAQYFYNQKNYILGYALAKLAVDFPEPSDLCYVENWIYSYGTLAVLGNCALEMGNSEEAISTYRKIAKKSKVPEDIRKQAIATIHILEEKKVAKKD